MVAARLSRALGVGSLRSLTLSPGARRILRLPDRRLMAESFIPAFAAEGGRILAIGCRGYNREDYGPLLAAGAEIWTTDIDPAAAPWGVAGHHRTGDACRVDILFADLSFDAVICNGVLGHGVDTADQQRQALAAIASLLRPGGRLLLGWNTDAMPDPVAAGLTARDFAPAPFAGHPARVTFADVTHVYDSLVRVDSAGA